MAQQSLWRRWFRGKEPPPPPEKEPPPPSEEVALATLQQAYFSQRRRWDYAIALCALLTLVAGVLRPLFALLPGAATVFAILQYRKCSQMVRTIWEADVLRRWVEKLNAEARQEEEKRQRGEE
jgi:hypothetical protein